MRRRLLEHLITSMIWVAKVLEETRFLISFGGETIDVAVDRSRRQMSPLGFESRVYWTGLAFHPALHRPIGARARERDITAGWRKKNRTREGKKI